MKTLFTLPPPERQAFFDHYASLIPTLHKLGYLSQAVSALTEFGIIYAIIYSSLADFWPAFANYAALTGAIIGTAFLEIGLRKFLPYSFRAILFRRFFGSHLPMTLFIFLATIALLFTSGYLSFKGSKSLVESVAPQAEQRTTTEADSLADKDRLVALETYRVDSTAIEGRFASQIEAIQAATELKVGQYQAKLNSYRAQERASEKSLAGAKNRQLERIAAAKAEAASQIATLKAQQAEELSQLHQANRSKLAQIDQDLGAARDSVSNYNAQSIATVNRKVNQYGGGLGYFTVVCLGVLVLSIALKEIHAHGSGIEERAQPNQYYFSEPIGAAFSNMVSDAWNYYTRSAIAWLEDLTPDPPKPKQPPTLYELTETRPPRHVVSYGANADESIAVSQNDVEAPTKIVNDNRAPEIQTETIDNRRTCAHCNQKYQHRHHKQKYCSEDCRIQAWENRHGRPFRKGKSRRTANN